MVAAAHPLAAAAGAAMLDSGCNAFDAVVAAAREVFDAATASGGGNDVGTKRLSNHVRERTGLSLSLRELDRVARAAKNASAKKT